MPNKRYNAYLILLNSLLFIGILPAISDCQVSPPKNIEAKEYYYSFSSNWLDTTPVQGEIEPLLYKRTGFEYTCNECHKDINTLQKYYKPAGEHRNIRLNHGLNVNCLNCHHQNDRNSYAAYGNDKIPSEDSYRVCMKCHGPIFRDWEAGIHGRVNGYWAVELGPQKKLDCTQCHDPHSPAFKPLIPMPKPEASRIKTLSQDDLHE